MALADDAAERLDDDDAEQYGLGRGLGAILAEGGRSVVAGRGLDRLIPPPPMPVMPRGALVPEAPPVGRGEPSSALERQLEGLAVDFDLDVAMHLSPRRVGLRLIVARPSRGALPSDDMDVLCGTVREFAASTRLTTDDFVAAGHQCVAFGNRPLGASGLHVVGRRGRLLTVDERWAIHRRLAALLASA